MCISIRRLFANSACCIKYNNEEAHIKHNLNTTWQN